MPKMNTKGKAVRGGFCTAQIRITNKRATRTNVLSLYPWLLLSHVGGGMSRLSVVHVELVLVRSHSGRHARQSVVRRHLSSVGIHSPGVGLAVHVAVDRLELVREGLGRESERSPQLETLG